MADFDRVPRPVDDDRCEALYFAGGGRCGLRLTTVITQLPREPGVGVPTQIGLCDQHAAIYHRDGVVYLHSGRTLRKDSPADRQDRQLPPHLPTVPNAIDLTAFESDSYGLITVSREAAADAHKLRMLAGDAWRMGLHYFDLYFALLRRSDALDLHAKYMRETATDVRRQGS